MKSQVKLLKAVFVLAALGFGHAAWAGDRCESWEHRGYPVSFQACSYENGGSGYYVVENNGRSPAAICWTVNFNDGRSDNGCNSNMAPGESTRGSCFRCGSKNGGARDFTLRSYETRR